MAMAFGFSVFVEKQSTDSHASKSGKRLHAWMFAAAVLLAMLLAQPSAAQINVTTTTQGDSRPAGSSTTTDCSFQEAMYATQFGGPYAIGQTDPDTSYQTGCTDPSGFWYQIVLPAGTTLQFDHFWDGDGHNPFGPTATPIVCNVIDIVGNGATLEWTGTGNSRLFAVGYAQYSPSGAKTGTFCGAVVPNLTLENVYIKGFQVKGGDGTAGGGGGLGAGGAIYIGKLPGKDSPYLTIQNSTFDGNTVTGGSGAVCSYNTTNGEPLCGGGGGGLYGAGGSGSGLSGGGGGGGSRGDGGASTSDAGGGGGGTVYGNGDANGNIGGAAGTYCGGNGGDNGNDGHNGSCPGGGGGGGGAATSCITTSGFDYCGGNGGSGAYGGGGAAGGYLGNGGNGGFGGGGGAAACCSFTLQQGGTVRGGYGGNGGFGAGGGMGEVLGPALTGGSGGYFGGDAVKNESTGIGRGAAGAGMGGAIFNDSGTVLIQNSTFTNNKSTGGGDNTPSCCGNSEGAVIFSRNGSLTVESSTIAKNNVGLNGVGGTGITVFGDSAGAATFTLHNTIIANNGEEGFASPCEYIGTVANAVSFSATGNLITGNAIPGYSSSLFPQQADCATGVASTADPLLGTLSVSSPGHTPTMAIPYGSSPATDAGDDTAAANDGITTDQRGEARPQGPHVDIGAYEAAVKYPLTLQVSPAGGGSTSPSGTVWEDPSTVVNVSATAASGYYFLNWTGSVASTNSASTTVTMGTAAQTITANFQQHDFSIGANPNPVSLKLGGTASSTVTVTSLGNFADKVSLAASGAPSGITASLSPTSLTPAVGGSPTATLSFTAGPSVTPQNFTETVTGSSTSVHGALSHPVYETVTMVVTAADIVNVVNENQALGCIDNSGIGQSLNAKLNAFQTLSTGGHLMGAVNTMSAFQYEVQAQTGQHIASTCTDGGGTQFSPPQTLITDTTYLLAGVGAAQVKAHPIVGSVVNSSKKGISGATVNLLNSSKTVIATSITDAVGFYYFAGTDSLTVGGGYTVKVTLPKGYKSSTPSAQSFTWSASRVALGNFVLN